MDQVGYAICHQLSERSLAYGGRALPVCARDTGVFLGFAACFIVLLLAYGREPRRYPSWPKLLALALFIVPTALDAATSYAGLRESSNAIRVATGSLAGTALAALVFPMASSVVPPSGDPGERPAVFESWYSIPLLLAVPAAISLLLWLDWPGAYWTWAPMVTLAIVFTLLALNFTLIALAIAWKRGEDRVPGAGPLAGLALAAALVEVVLSNRLHWLVQRVL
jgi:uncharacterized membrane protein